MKALTNDSPWTVEELRALLAIPFAKGEPARTLADLLHSPPRRGWIEARGGVQAVYAYMRSLPLPPKQRAMLEAFLANPGETLTNQIAALDIPETSFQRYLKALLATLVDQLNLWQVAASSPAGAPPQPEPASSARLPAQTTTLVGRRDELGRLQAMLSQPDVRLVTVTGPGGVGKTRLALGTAEALRSHFSQAVYFVPLASIGDPALAASAILSAIGAREEGAAAPAELVKVHLAGRPALLLLDNFEHVLAAAPLVASLLEALPQLSVLATSREPLKLYGERELPLQPLAAPAAGEPLQPAQLEQYEAARLLLERARAVRPDLQVTEENVRALAGICRRLDGLPLAIELAAARLKLFSPQALLARLETQAPGQIFQLLSDGPRARPARQQTLWAAIEWSYTLLSPEERLLFRQLAIFQGGCTIAAATEICDGDDPLANLSSLVDKSLLRQETAQDHEPRFAMLETLREYARQQLDPQEHVRLCNRHARFYLQLAEQAAPELRGANQKLWLMRLAEDRENLRAGLAWALERQDHALAGRLAAALWRFWRHQANLAEGRRWLALVLQYQEQIPPAQQASLLLGAGILACQQNDHRPAAQALQAALALFRALDDLEGITSSLNHMAQIAWRQGDYDQARLLLEESLALHQQHGDRRGTADILNNLGVLAFDQGELERASTLYSQVLQLQQELGNQLGCAATLANLGGVALLKERYGEARTLFEQALALYTSLGEKWGFASCCTSLGLTWLFQEPPDRQKARSLMQRGLAIEYEMGDKAALATGLEDCMLLAASEAQPWRVTRLAGAAEALRQQAGEPLSPVLQPNYQRLLADARAQLGEQAYQRELAAGMALSLEQAIACAVEQ